MKLFLELLTNCKVQVQDVGKYDISADREDNTAFHTENPHKLPLMRILALIINTI